MTDTRVTRNTELLEQTMQFIDDHPEQHNQSNWMCRTTACYAGHAALQAGWQVVDTPLVKKWYRKEHIMVAAQDELGLTKDEAAILFTSTNTIDMLKLMVKDLVNGDELRPHDYYREADA